jgi:hypothetical protein
MYPINKCMTTLRLLIADGNPRCIPGAESAIDELIAAHDAPQRGVGALRALEEELTPIWNFATGKQLYFANVLFDYIAARISTLASSDTIPARTVALHIEKNAHAQPQAGRRRFSWKQRRKRAPRERNAT